MKKLLLVDVDGVLLDWIGGFATWIRKYQFSDHSQYKFATTGVKLLEDGPIPKEIVTNYIKLFNSSLEFGYLNAIEGAKKGLNHLYKKEWEIVTLSSFSDDELAFAAREDNIHDHFGHVFSDCDHLPLDASKKASLQYYRDTYPDHLILFIDDSPQHVIDALEVGIDAKLFVRPHNNQHDLVRDYGVNWNDIVERYY
jgi:FMN phosphatase YigB (HAD superfamily)